MHMRTAGTREKGGCEKKREGIERAFGFIEFRGERNSGPGAGFDQAKVPNRGPGEQLTMIRVEKGEKRRRAAVLQDTLTIKVADFGLFTG